MQDVEVLRTVWKRWPDEHRGPFVIALTLGELGGEFGCLGFEMWAYPPEHASPHLRPWPEPQRLLNATDIRVPLASMVQEQAQDVAKLFGSWLEDEDGGDPTRGEWLARKLAVVQGRPADLPPTERFALIADTYVQAMRSGRSTNEAVRERFGVGKAAAAQLINRAREAGMLTPAPRRGVAGGELTSQCEAVLRSMAVEADDLMRRGIEGERVRQEAEAEAWDAHSRKGDDR